MSLKTETWVHRSPIFYGWIVLLVGTVGMIMTSPGQTFSVSIFIEQFIADLGLSRSLVSTLYTGATLTASFALPLVGRRIDRYGPRVMVVIVAILFGVACIYMGFVTNALMLGLGFVAIRMFGQGSLMLVSQNLINRWWVRRRGMIMGVASMSMSLLGIGMFPNLINWLIPQYGWRWSYILLGLMLLLVMVPLGFFFFRDQPEDYDLLPDGEPVLPPDKTLVPTLPIEENWSSEEALRTPAFWVVALGVATIAMLATGQHFHMVSIFADNGLTSTQAAQVFIPVAMMSALATLSSGILVDRMPVRFLLAGGLFLQALSYWMTPLLAGQEWGTILLYGVVLGAAGGLMGTINNVAWAIYFGRQHMGSIAGVGATVMVCGSALGPMPLGLARDWLGNYNQVLFGLAFLPLTLGAVSLFVKRPRKEIKKDGF